MFDRPTLPAFALLLCAALPAGLRPVAITDGALELHPRPENAVTLPAEGMSLWDLLTGLERDTGTHLVAEKGIRDYLEGWPIVLSRPMEVPAEARWSTAETYLAEAGGLFEELRQSEPRMLAVRIPNDAERRQVLAGIQPRFVPLDRVPSLSEYPASMIATSVPLPDVEARSLSNSMRAMLTDTSQLNLVPAGDASSMVVRGLASQVAEVCELLQVIQAQAAEEAARAAAAEAARADAGAGAQAESGTGGSKDA